MDLFCLLLLLLLMITIAMVFVFLVFLVFDPNFGLYMQNGFKFVCCLSKQLSGIINCYYCCCWIRCGRVASSSRVVSVLSSIHSSNACLSQTKKFNTEIAIENCLRATCSTNLTDTLTHTPWLHVSSALSPGNCLGNCLKCN